MTRFRLAIIICTVLLTVSFVSLAAYIKRPGGGGNAPIPEAVSYAKPTADGRHVFVAFGDPAAEAKLTDAVLKASATQVRGTYPQPGLYNQDDLRTLLYTLDGYAPDDQVFLSDDGEQLIRIEGEWWKTKAYPAGKRLSETTENALLDSVAVACYTHGQLTHQYTLRELVTQPGELPHSPEHILWPAGAVLNPSTKQFHLYTQDSNAVTFDLTTGEIVARNRRGLNNPIAQAIIWGTVALTILLAAGILWFTMRRQKNPQRPH